VATEVLEHVYEPMKYLEAFATALKPGGFLLTNLGSHEPELMHVSLELAPLHAALVESGWRVLRPKRLYQKPERA
jgi:2-polyprenyl-3-methyl-5-hydroxy-6-metoxy-1,4-benzoquinol methylase